MSANRRKGWEIMLAVVIAAGSLLVLAYYPQISNLKSEYVTASVIRDLDTYIATHPGRWPKCWADLGNGSDRSIYTKFRFDLSVEAVRHEPVIIYGAVTPTRGDYRTYPHARSQLDEVLRKIEQQRQTKTTPLE